MRSPRSLVTCFWVQDPDPDETEQPLLPPFMPQSTWTELPLASLHDDAPRSPPFTQPASGVFVPVDRWIFLPLAHSTSGSAFKLGGRGFVIRTRPSFDGGTAPVPALGEGSRGGRRA